MPNQHQPPIFLKIIFSLPLFIATIGVIFILNFHPSDPKLLPLATLFTAEFIMLVTAAILLIFLFKRSDRSNLKYIAIINVLIFISAGFIGVRHFF